MRFLIHIGRSSKKPSKAVKKRGGMVFSLEKSSYQYGGKDEIFPNGGASEF